MMNWYKKIAIWKLVIFILTPFAGIGEGAIFMTGAHPIWHLVILSITGILAALNYFGKDENNNGVVDALEDK